MNKKNVISGMMFLIVLIFIFPQNQAEYEHMAAASYYAYDEINNTSSYLIPVIVGEYLLNQIADPYIHIGADMFMGMSNSGSGSYEPGDFDQAFQLSPRMIIKNIGPDNFKFSGEIILLSPLSGGSGPSMLPYTAFDMGLVLFSDTDWDFSVKGLVKLFNKAELGFEYEKKSFISSAPIIYPYEDGDYIEYNPHQSDDYYFAKDFSSSYYNYYLNLIDLNLDWLLPDNQSPIKERRIE